MNARRRFLIRGSLLLLAVAGIAAGSFFLSGYPPTDASFYPKCTLHHYTGLHCPGCGLTRATHALMFGRVAQATAYNAFAVVVLPYLVFLILRGLWHWAWGTPARPARRWPNWLIWTIVAVFVGFGVLRNIPVYPFTLLAPHEIAP